MESFDGFKSYLLVVDKTTRYAWIFPTKTKKPPVEIIRLFLEKYGHEEGGLIRVDQGGELAWCTEWRTMVLKEHRYVVEPTGADSPSQKWTSHLAKPQPRNKGSTFNQIEPSVSGGYIKDENQYRRAMLSQLCGRCKDTPNHQDCGKSGVIR